MDPDNVAEDSTSVDPNFWKLYEEISSTTKKLDGVMEKFEHLSSTNENGLSIFDVKADSMFTYLNNLFYIILKKCSGQPINDYETRERLAEMRIVLEKLKPLELKLKYQIEKYIKQIDSSGENNVVSKSNYKAKLDDLQSDTDEVSESDEDESKEAADQISTTSKPGKSTNVYKPPKLAAVPYDDSNEEEKRKKKLEHSKKRALTSSIMQELKEEYLDTPLEISSATTLRNKRSNYRQERENYEETYFTRLPTTKKDRHRDKVMSSLTLGTLGTEVTRFEDISALNKRNGTSSKKRTKSHSKIKTKSKGGGNVFKKRRTH